jgi:hypothetical protein
VIINNTQRFITITDDFILDVYMIEFLYYKKSYYSLSIYNQSRFEIINFSLKDIENIVNTINLEGSSNKTLLFAPDIIESI